MSKARRVQRDPTGLTVVTAVLACATALFYALHALFQIVPAIWTH
jgi:hypothetical protein